MFVNHNIAISVLYFLKCVGMLSCEKVIVSALPVIATLGFCPASRENSQQNHNNRGCGRLLFFIDFAKSNLTFVDSVKVLNTSSWNPGHRFINPVFVIFPIFPPTGPFIASGKSLIWVSSWFPAWESHSLCSLTPLEMTSVCVTWVWDILKTSVLPFQFSLLDWTELCLHALGNSAYCLCEEKYASWETSNAIYWIKTATAVYMKWSFFKDENVVIFKYEDYLYRESTSKAVNNVKIC